MLAALQALAEFRHFQADRLAMKQQLARSQGSLVLEQGRMHLPEFPLLSCAVSRLGRLERIPVDRLQRKVADDILELSCLDVVALDLWQRLTDVSRAEWSLVIGKIDQRQLRAFLSFEGGIGDIQNDIDGLPW